MNKVPYFYEFRSSTDTNDVITFPSQRAPGGSCFSSCKTLTPNPADNFTPVKAKVGEGSLYF